MTDETPLDAWLRDYDPENGVFEAEANVFVTDMGYRVDWHLICVGLVRSVEFDTLADAYDWLDAEGFIRFI